MKDLTREFPLGVQDYTVVHVQEWQWWWAKEQDMLDWLRDFDHPSWFAWERPRGLMILGDRDVAALFVLRWL